MSARDIFLTAVLVSLSFSATADAGVVNGTFADGAGDSFTGWSTFPGLDAPTAGFDGDRFVRFEEGLSSFTQIEQALVIPTNATTLSFDFLLESDPPGATAVTPDAFQASFLDPVSFLGLLPGGDPGLQPGFFLKTFEGDILKNGATADPVSVGGSGARASWERVVVDITSLRGQSVILDFTLLSGIDFGIETSASLDNVVIATQTTGGVVPEPTSGTLAVVLAACGVCFRPRRRRR